MQILESLLKSKKLNYKDIVTYFLVEKFELRTAQELAKISDCNYSRLTQSLNILLELDLIEKTKESPARYIINDTKDN